MSKKALINRISELQTTLQYTSEDRDDAYSVLEVQRALRVQAQEELRELREKIDSNWPGQKATFKAPKEPNKHSLVLSFDLFPLSDWWRFRYDSYRPGLAMQVCVGPLRLDFFAY